MKKEKKVPKKKKRTLAEFKTKFQKNAKIELVEFNGEPVSRFSTVLKTTLVCCQLRELDRPEGGLHFIIWPKRTSLNFDDEFFTIETKFSTMKYKWIEEKEQ
jgi:hypothetical protein